jgi:hypothetical protein
MLLNVVLLRNTVKRVALPDLQNKFLAVSSSASPIVALNTNR